MLLDPGQYDSSRTAMADFLATHDEKHLLAQARAIENAYGMTVLPPAEVLRILAN